MSAGKPQAGLRRTTRGDRKQPTPAETLEQRIALEKIARKHERPNETVDERPARGVVKRAGRTRADGTPISLAGEKRRLAVYIPLELFDELEARARAARATLSDQTTESLAFAFGIDIKAAG